LLGFDDLFFFLPEVVPLRWEREEEACHWKLPTKKTMQKWQVFWQTRGVSEQTGVETSFQDPEFKNLRGTVKLGVTKDEKSSSSIVKISLKEKKAKNETRTKNRRLESQHR
jgi:hypothetical protein